MVKKQFTYKEAGVDIDAGEASVKRIKADVATTFNQHVLKGIGHFGAMYQVPINEYKNPILVSSVDGVGTKLKVAVMMDKHDTIGEDIVNHCINDIFTTGAKPLYFLDYLSLGKVDPENVNQIVSGMVRGCRNANCALIGGETAEMVDLYQPGEYDLAGTVVGIVEKENIIDGTDIKSGDCLIGLKSSGLHTNGYTLARKIFFDQQNLKADSRVSGLEKTIGETLLEIHRNYYPIVSPIVNKFDIHGLSHITGGGILGNTARILPEGLGLEIDWNFWPRLSVFNLIQEFGNVPEEDMRRTFNLGIGFILIVSKDQVDMIQSALKYSGEESYVIGEVIEKV
jgi:phosphoribosylformylglycinamidine cyclo-ligase